MPFFTGDNSLLQLNPEKFDFSVQFESLFFTIIPSALFILASIWRTLSQARKAPVVNAPVFQLVKVGAITVYVALELTTLILAAIGSFHVTNMFIAASVLKLASALLMITLSIIDHSRSPRPSILLNIYLLITLLFDATQARTLFLASEGKAEHTYSSVFTTAVVLKAMILLLEAKSKTRWVHWNEKEHSPEETSSVFSLGVLFWLNKLFQLGHRKVLMVEDLYPLDVNMDAKLLHEKFSKNMDYSRLKGHKYGLVKVLIRTLKVPLLLPVVPRLCMLGFTFCQPLLLESLTKYLSGPELDANIGYGFIGAAFFIYSGIAISMAFYWYFHNRARTMTRSILVTEIFIKATKARIALGDDSAALTLMSTDMERIRVGFRSLHEPWAASIQAALASWMLYNRLGVVFLVPIGMVMVCFTFLAILMNWTGDSQKAWMSGVQKRVGLTATVISSMKNLKISGLTSPVGEFVQKLRVIELAKGVRWRKIFITAAMLGFIPQLIAPPITFAASQRTLDVSTMFTSLAFITILTYPLLQVFEGIPQIISGIACLSRIQSFLECETRDDFRRVLADMQRNAEKIPEDSQALSGAVLEIKDGAFGWEADKLVLQNVNTRINKSSLTIVVGSIGAGKSTLCKALLGEIPFTRGSVVLSNIFAHVGFCEQAPFLSNGTIKDNIIGFSPINNERYAEVIHATALQVDFATLALGDQTNIGSDGITLSGGQKQRVALARALYLQSDLLVLDDVFSGLDADTEEQVFQQVFGPSGLLRRRRATVVLCTHSIRHLPAADHVLVLADGTVAEQGGFEELNTNQGYVQRLGLSTRSTSEISSDGTDSQESSLESKQQVFPITTLSAEAAPLAEEPDSARQMGDKTVYKHYAQAVGWFLVSLSLFFAIGWGFFTNFPTIWLTYWTNDAASEHPTHSFSYYAGIYALLKVCGLISLLLLAITLWVFAIERAGANLHQDALQTLLRAPLRFFTTTDTGVVTNLFSQDLNLIDTELPEATLNTLFCVFQAIGQAAVMLTSSAYLGIAYPFLGILLYYVGKFYLRTSRQLRFLDLEAKSPLYTHFLDNLKGITTIRAFGFLPKELEKNIRLLNTSQRPAYLLLMIQEWLNLVLGLVVMSLAVIMVTLSVRLHSNSAFAGASLYSLITLGENLAGIVLYWTRLETSIGAIARLKTFSQTVQPEDKDEEDIIPPEQWPQTGVVKLEGVSASYGAEEDEDAETEMKLALRNIDIMIRSGEKVAICGRTGSGKSSLIALLLKLLDPTSATADRIVIDDIPLHKINRSALRQRIIAVPQEAVFLPDGSTYMTNLDPFNASTPDECEAVLTAVGLWSFVEDRGGLHAGMSASTLSAGQRQLMSVGRALLRRKIHARSIGMASLGFTGVSDRGILLLDEVSSSVDYATERVIQEIIQTEFKNYTVISVSHRLDMIMDFDRVVVMDAGEVAEVGNPRFLADDQGTRFGDLVRAAANDKTK
ncbi:P-loop containing nucleoside triphosphate hydrolase protein [Pyrenochaeta sp. MPI-SDFR-AT-0127]|nr:P-loop containing nucleoside triphosphate hydrolase protein [Pyrenochaeta sp. MPI-SDFR-AT-0127]